MNATDVFLLVIRWLHLVTATAWVGGSIFYLLVLGPASRRAPDSWVGIRGFAAAEFQTIVDVSIVVLLITGVILTLNRLTGVVVDAAYVITLGVKIALSVWMLQLVRIERRRGAVPRAYREAPREARGHWRSLMDALSGFNAITIIGLIVFLLSDLLKVLFEQALSRS